MRLPEDADRLQAFRSALAGRDQHVIDTVERTREALARDGLHLLENPGVPLRPLFLDRARLDRICRALHRNVVALGHAVAETHDDALLPFPRDFLDAVHGREVLTSKRFGLVLRPDGFLFDDSFAFSEPNHGNGYLISATYPEAVHAVFDALGCAARVERPLRHIFAMLHAQAGNTPRPRLALFWHSEEHAIISEWNERTQGILKWLPTALEKDGFDVVFAHEDELSVAKNGDCVCGGKRVDLVLQIPIGTHFLYAPEKLSGPLKHLTGETIGNAPFLQPLAHLAIDKGTMPFWQTLPCWDETPGVAPIPTHFPTPDRATEYRLEKAKWVLKRSFEGKDTHAGISANARVWNRALETAMHTHEYVMQPYVRMSVAPMPVIDRGRIAWVDVNVELSLFVIDGAYAGAFARFLPEGDGHVLSPPPPGMGFTLVSA